MRLALARGLLRRPPGPPGLPGLPGPPGPPGLAVGPVCLQRCYSETQKPTNPTDPTLAKDLVVPRAAGVRVRRAGRQDAARVLRLVRGAAPPAAAAAAARAGCRLALTDYVARTLAQGHTLLAERAGGGRELRGAALGLAVSPWDPALLEQWARCVRDPRARRLVALSAECLRAPALHDKYDVNRLLQVILIVPPEQPDSGEVVASLLRHTITRGQEGNFPLLRIDATNSDMVKSIEKLQLNLIKECGLCVQLDPLQIRKIEKDTMKKDTATDDVKQESKKASEYPLSNPQDDNKEPMVTVYSMKPGDQTKTN